MTRKKLLKPAAEPSKIVNANVECKIEDNTEKDQNLPILQCRGFLSQFATSVRNWKVDDFKWGLLRRTPFGKIIESVLELDINVQIVDALLGFWDEEHCGFFIGRRIVPFTVDDIALITGLPNRGLQVVRKRARLRIQTQFCHLKPAFWTVGLIEESLDEIIRKKDAKGDKFFVQLMILYLWSSVMFPSSSGIVPQYMTSLLGDLDALGTYNWAEALHSSLVKEIINVKSKLLKNRKEGTKNATTYFYGLYFAINVWFFEHVNFGEDSQPSDPNGRPRLLKWAKACKFWQKKPFLARLGEIGEDKVSFSLLPRDDEYELVSHAGTGRKVDEKKEAKEEEEEEEATSDAEMIKKIVHVVLKQNAQMATLEKRIAKLESLAEGFFEHKDEEVDVGFDEEIARGRKREKLIAKEPLALKKKKGCSKEEEELAVSRQWENMDSDMLVNLDDYASPADIKMAKPEPLSYVGREVLTEEERVYLDAFCKKPMQRDDIVFYNWNIIIRRQSMVEYLKGGCTSEEIIDAYARILHERANASGYNFASFLYVSPMFLALYRNNLGSYKTFLNTVNKESLEDAKFLFLPCHVSSSGHWLLLVCDMDMKKWQVIDSLYDPRHREVSKEQMMLLANYLFLDHDVDVRSWSLEYKRVYPQQEAGTLDCGVFVMKFMETIVVDVSREIKFQATDMRLFRPRIAYQILCHG